MFLHKHVVGPDVWLEVTTKDRHANEYDLADLEWKGLGKTTFFIVERVTDHSRFRVGVFAFSPMPGCCGVVVSHGSALEEKSKHSGMSQPFRDVKVEVAKLFGYSLMIGTTDMANIPAVGSFMKIYTICTSFMNKRTNHLVSLGWRKL